MASKDKAVWTPEKGAFQIQYRTNDGSLKVRDTIPLVHRMEASDSIKAMGGWAKSQSTLREAALSLLAEILTHAGAELEGYKGTCDPAKNLPAEMAASFRSAEESYFKKFLDTKHPAHQIFVKNLPTVNERQEKLEVNGKLEVNRQFQYFLTAMRKAPSYANAKNTVLGYWGYCGQSPIAEGGENLVPPEIMRVYVSEVRTVEAADNSFKGRVYALRREWMGEAKNPPDIDLPEIVATLRELLSHAETQATAAAQRATAQPRKGQSVPAATDEAIRKAQESTGRVKSADAVTS